MSSFGPMYEIPEIIRNGIIILTDPNYNNEVKENMLEKIRKNFESQAHNMSSLELKEVINYLNRISNHIEDIHNNYALLGIGVTNSEQKEEEIQMFFRHMLRDYKLNLVSNLKIIDKALIVVNMAREELGKFLSPVLESADGIVLCKVDKVETNTNKNS